MLVRSDLGGVTLGWDLSHSAADEMHAAIEGMALHTRIILERMASGGGLSFQRVINGGGIPQKNDSETRSMPTRWAARCMRPNVRRWVSVLAFSPHSPLAPSIRLRRRRQCCADRPVFFIPMRCAAKNTVKYFRFSEASISASAKENRCAGDGAADLEAVSAEARVRVLSQYTAEPGDGRNRPLADRWVARRAEVKRMHLAVGPLGVTSKHFTQAVA